MYIYMYIYIYISVKRRILRGERRTGAARALALLGLTRIYLSILLSIY